MRTAALVIALACGTAHAGPRRGYQDGFIGWSKDNTFFAMTTSGTDEMDVPLLCVSKRGATPPSWPKKVPLPTKDDVDGCTERWDVMFEDNEDDAQTLVKQVTAMVVRAKSSKTGPKGETVAVKRAKGALVEVLVSRAGKVVARGTFELSDAGAAVPNQIDAYWRPDGGVVAVVAGYKPTPGGNGYGPPRFVVVAELEGPLPIAVLTGGDRQRATSLNVEGLKLVAAKKLDQAQKKFEQAVAADDSFALAYYNLACAASLRKDKDAAMKALRRLATMIDKPAQDALVAGKTDHDLDWIASTNAEAAKILHRK